MVLNMTAALATPATEAPHLPCNGSCTHATSIVCECSCGGVNHGTAHGDSLTVQRARGAQRTQARHAAAGGAFAFLAQRGGLAMDDEAF